MARLGQYEKGEWDRERVPSEVWRLAFPSPFRFGSRSRFGRYGDGCGDGTETGTPDAGPGDGTRSRPPFPVFLALFRRKVYLIPMTWALNLISYPRAIFMLVFGAVITFAMSLIIPFFAWATKSRKVVDWLIIYGWSLPLVKFAGVRVEVRGAELVRKANKGYLILFNHSSLWDIPVLYAYFPRSFRFGAKVELFDIPLFGYAMKVCGVLPIDRRNRNKVMKVYEGAISRIDNGESFALAPEGTRQGATQLGPFKRGPFEFAINAQSEIVPVILAGALKVLPKHSFWLNVGRFRRRIILQILPPISGADYTMETVQEFQDRVWALMDPIYRSLNEELSLNPS
jgi:1-acyl-sn-glycerol-3-phosphate acyltransferase